MTNKVARKPFVVMASESPPTAIYKCGVGVVIETLIAILRQAGWQVEWTYPSYPERQGVEGESTLYSTELRGQNGYRITWFWWMPIMGLANFIKIIWRFVKRRPDLVILHGAHQTSQIMAMAARLLRIPIASQLHVMDDYYIEKKAPPSSVKFAKAYQRAMNRLVMSLSTVIFCPSRWYDRYFKNYCGHNKPVRIMPSLILENKLIVDKFDFKQSFLMSLGHSADTPLIISFGRVGPEKNAEFLLRAMKEMMRISPEDKKPVLVLAGGGDGTYCQHLKNMAEIWNFGDNFHILGPYELDYGLKLMQIADLVWLPSKSETQGLVAGEAMQTTVVMVLDGYAMAEYVKVPDCLMPEEAEVWAKTSAELLSDKARYLQVKESLALLSRDYTDEPVFTERLLSTYQSLFANQPLL